MRFASIIVMGMGLSAPTSQGSDLPETLTTLFDMRHTFCLLLLIATAPVSVEYDSGSYLDCQFEVNSRDLLLD